ncbi:MAG: O-antigen ligase family protein [Candidatus Eremiobacteraeota bacterium]|nr:O-antigen ligase family protein [Candidatus Eremiobacteraeota bacterium]
MTYSPVIDRFAVPTPLDPPAAIFFVFAAVVAAVLTARRPAYGLAALLLATPIAFAHDAFGTTITLPKSVLAGVLIGLTTYTGAAAGLRRRPAPALLGALGFYFVATALTLPGAAHRGPAVREALKVLEYAAFFIAAYLCYRLDRDDAPPLIATAIASIVVSLSALGQEIVGAPSGLYVGSAIVPRIAGLLEGPNQLSGYCEIAVATLGAWALVRRSRLLDVALALAVCADVLTFSRAGLIGLAVVAALLVLAGGRGSWRALAPGAFGLIGGLAGAGLWAIYAHTPGLIRASLAPSLYAGGVGNRSELWHAAWRMWLARPLFGVGAGNFELLLPAYGVLGVRTHANSWYVQSLAEGGVLLFAATVVMLVVIVVSLIDKRPPQRWKYRSPWIVAALGSTLALAFHQTVDYLVFFPKVGGAWWLLIGIAAAALASGA